MGSPEDKRNHMGSMREINSSPEDRKQELRGQNAFALLNLDDENDKENSKENCNESDQKTQIQKKSFEGKRENNQKKENGMIPGALTRSTRRMQLSNGELERSIDAIVKFDSGSTGNHGNWITPQMAETIEAKRSEVEGVRMYSPLGSEYSVREKCTVQLYDKEWNMGIQIECSIFGEGSSEELPYDVVVGDNTMENEGLWLMLAQSHTTPNRKEGPPEEQFKHSEDAEDDEDDIEEMARIRFNDKANRRMEEWFGAMIEELDTEQNRVDAMRANRVDAAVNKGRVPRRESNEHYCYGAMLQEQVQTIEWTREQKLEALEKQIGEEFENPISRRKLIDKMLPYVGDVLVDKLRPGAPMRVRPANVPIKKDAVLPKIQRRGMQKERLAVLDQWLKKMLEADLIESDNSVDTASPIHVVRDPSGKWRVTQDSSRINAVFETVRGEIPVIREIVDAFQGGRLKMVCDLVMAYHQYPATREMRKLWAFSTPHRGNFVYRDRLPMGDKNAPVLFNSALKECFAETGIMPYFDDLLASENDDDKFIQLVIQCLSRCKELNIKLSIDKLQIARKETDALGYIFSSESYRPRDRMKRKFLAAPFPSKSELKSWIGLLNQFSPFSSEIAQVRGKFAEAMKKGAIVERSDANLAAFAQAKTIVANLPTLHSVKPGYEIFIDTDASEYGVGSVIYHRINGVVTPIRFDSKVLSQKANAEWETITKETYAIVRALQTYEYLLRGREFTVRTDHRNLCWLDKAEKRMHVNWRNIIAEFDFKVVHVSGANNVIADSLSRVFHFGMMLKKDGITKVDEVIKDAFLRVHNPVVGHAGIGETVRRIQRILNMQNIRYKSNIRQQVTALISSCMICQKLRSRRNHRHIEHHSLHGHKPFDSIQADFIEGLPTTVRGNTAILINVDTFTKFVFLKAVEAQTDATVRETLHEISSYFSVPRKYVTDGGAQFQSKVMSNYLSFMGTEQLITHPHQPSTHGIVERKNRDVLDIIKKLIHELQQFSLSDWDILLPTVARILNNSRSSATGYAPVTLMFGTDPFNDVDMMSETAIEYSDKDEYVRRLKKFLTRFQHLANERLDDNAIENRMKSIDQNMLPDLEIGTFVLLLHRPSDTRNVKVTLPWRGPLKVVGCERKDFYLCHDLVQDVDIVAHRVELTPVKCSLTEIEARKAAALDGESEIEITNVLGHTGVASKLGSLEFKCQVEGFTEPIYFLFRNCKYVTKVQEYCLKDEKLKGLSKTWLVDNSRVKKSNKLLLQDYIV